MRQILRLFAIPLMGLVIMYRWFVSPLFPQCCRFQPSCSEYGREALKRHGLLWGSVLTIKRILKCHPWGPSGFDPVPLTRECEHE